MRQKTKRALTDLAGYLLLIAAILTGWLPGPGGIPFAMAGLGLLSIHNAWAMRLREYVLTHGGTFVRIIFPKNPLFEGAYDAIVVLLLVLAGILAYRRAAAWQLGLAVSAFFFATFIALMNRDRLNRIKKTTGRQKKRNEP